jgi:hypothetical protein
MTAKINSYFATLLITIWGAGAALLIIHAAYANNAAAAFEGSEASYAQLLK